MFQTIIQEEDTQPLTGNYKVLSGSFPFFLFCVLFLNVFYSVKITATFMNYNIINIAVAKLRKKPQTIYKTKLSGEIA